MKTLSIRQPWAFLILHHGKDIENRTWWTGVRGRVLIHAGKGCTRAEYGDAADAAFDVCGIVLPALQDLDRGGIVGSVEIVDCVRASTSPWFVGPFGFVLRNAQPLPFRPCRGELGFFDVPAGDAVAKGG